MINLFQVEVSTTSPNGGPAESTNGGPAESANERAIEFDTLEIKKVDLNKSFNNSAHHTEEYEYPGLVVRRGQSFSIQVTISRPPLAGKQCSDDGMCHFVLVCKLREQGLELNWKLWRLMYAC